MESHKQNPASLTDLKNRPGAFGKGGGGGGQRRGEGCENNPYTHTHTHTHTETHTLPPFFLAADEQKDGESGYKGVQTPRRCRNTKGGERRRAERREGAGREG